MLIAKGNDPNAMANSGGTSLMFAAGAGHMEAAAVLIDAGADVNAKLKATSEFLDQVGRVFVFLLCFSSTGQNAVWAGCARVYGCIFVYLFGNNKTGV